MFLEILLNLCWLALALPAFVIWRRKSSSGCSACRSLLFLCALGCVLVLLFPIISASDDLHASSFAIEESRRSLHNGPGISHHNSGSFCPQIALLASGTPQFTFHREGLDLAFSARRLETLLVAHVIGRAPPA